MMENKQRKIVYSEPASFFSKESLKKYKLGEYNDDFDDNKKKTVKKKASSKKKSK